MSSNLQQILVTVRQGDYMSLIVLTAVGYDYVLTFSKEIEYIWGKRWTWISTLFVLVRYFGLFNLIIPMLSDLFVIIYGWSYTLFLCPADFVMILRVWVVYNQSRVILGTLLLFLALEAIFMILTAVIYSVPRNLSVTTLQIVNVTVCDVQSDQHLLIWTLVSTGLQVTVGTMMCLLMTVQFVRQSLQIHRANRQWQFNQYLSLFIKEGILYFLCILGYNIINALYDAGVTPAGGWQTTLLFIVELVPMYTLAPRFIVSIRELHARNIQGRHGVWIDAGFGLSSLSNTVCSEMVFANAGEDEEAGITIEEPPPMPG